MGEHGPHVGWNFFKKLLWTRCPIGINRGTIPHYLQFVNTNFGTLSYHNLLVGLLFRTYHVFVLVFLISQSRFGSRPAFVLVLVKNSYRLGCFCAHDNFFQVFFQWMWKLLNFFMKKNVGPFQDTANLVLCKSSNAIIWIWWVSCSMTCYLHYFYIRNSMR